MSWIRNLFIAILTLASSVVFAEPISLQAQSLEDYLSPAELVREFGLNPDGVLWQASFENPRLYIVVDKADHGDSSTAQTLSAFLDGQLIHRFKVSTAKEKQVTTPDGGSYFATTPEGEFRIYSRDRFHKSKKWNGAEMNFAQFFNGGIAIHATVPMHFDAIGQRDSGGCVRLMPDNAETMWNLVDQVGVDETKVIVFDGSLRNFPNVGQDMSQDQVGKPIAKPHQPANPRPQPQQPQPYNPYPTYPPQPTPPPPPPPGQPDTYPYCAPGYWCPYRT